MFPLDRRRFLADLARASALGGLTLAGRTEVFADDPKPANNNPSEMLRIAVIGAHGRGLDHIKGLAGKHNCQVTTLCDCDEGVIGKAMTEIEKAQGKSPKFEKDLRRVMDDPAIDAVTIAMPNHWHSLAAIWAMKAGKDVYVEKPVSHNIWEGRQLVETAKKHHRICQAGTQIRSMGGIQAAVAFLHAGKLGKVNRVYGTCYKRRKSIDKVNGTGSVPATCDYDLWCGPAPKEPLHRTKLHYDWHWQWACGNGDLGNQGIHQVDVGRWGLNKNSLPKSAMSLGGRYGYTDDGETANTQICWFDYGDCDMIFEVRGLETVDFLADRTGKPTEDKRRKAGVGLVFYGSEGMMVVSSYSEAIALTKDGEVIKVFSTPKNADLNHYGNFAAVVRSRKMGDLRGQIEQGHLSSALCHLGNISYRLGKETALDGSETAKLDCPDAAECITRMKKHLAANKVDVTHAKVQVGPKLMIDAAKETFIGNPAAVQMLSREYRKGYEVTKVV